MATMIAKLGFDVQYELARLVSQGAIQYNNLSMQNLQDMPAINTDPSTNATLASRILNLVSSKSARETEAFLENNDGGE